MTNKLFAEMEKRLLTESARNRDTKTREATAYANGFEEGIHKALEAFSAAEPNSPAAQSTSRTNLDRIRAMSAEEKCGEYEITVSKLLNIVHRSTERIKIHVVSDAAMIADKQHPVLL